jgi:hypothetical protein
MVIKKIDETGKIYYKVFDDYSKYLKDDVEKMLKHYAKQQKLEKQKAKYARIEY